MHLRTSMREGGKIMNAIDAVTQDYLKKDIPDFGVGDTVRVHIKIKEGNRERIQIFEGFVLKRQNNGVGIWRYSLVFRVVRSNI